MGRGLLTALVLAALPAFAARPVARPVRGSLDERGVAEDSVGVLVRFLGVTRPQAQASLDAVATQQSLSGGLRIGFLKTQASTLAVLYVVAPGPLKVAQLKSLAAACSRMSGVKAAYAFLHPGPRDEDLEAEAYWSFEGGELMAEKRLAFRDDDAFVQWARKRLTRASLEAKKWPGWPLSELTVSLGLPGRDFLERPLALLDLAAGGYPRDVGENLVLTVVYLPDATLLELRQLAETAHASPSKLVQQALAEADAGKKLGVQAPTNDRAPWDDEMPQAERAPPRPLELFLTRGIFDKLDERADEEAASLSKLVAYAWRQAHPYVAPKKVE